MSGKGKDNGMSLEDKALERFSDLMIKKIESLSKSDEWQTPWFSQNLAWPRNMQGRRYNGLNAGMLYLECEEKGYQIPVFGTFLHISSMNDKKGKGGAELPQVTVNKGEHGFPVYFTSYTVVDKETGKKIPYDDWKSLPPDEREKYKVHPRLHVSYVFNVDQTNIRESRPELYKRWEDALKPKDVVRDGNDMFVFPAMDKMIGERRWICPVWLREQDEAYYNISADRIVLPLKSQFKDGESFYGTAFHEMIHSTGRKDLLDRFSGDRDEKSYAREELVAEFGAALVAQYYGFGKKLKDESAAYLKSWLGALRENPKFLKTVLFDVKRASAVLTQKIDGISLDIKEGEEVVDNIPVKLTPVASEAVAEEVQRSPFHR